MASHRRYVARERWRRLLFVGVCLAAEKFGLVLETDVGVAFLVGCGASEARAVTGAKTVELGGEARAVVLGMRSEKVW